MARPSGEASPLYHAVAFRAAGVVAIAFLCAAPAATLEVLVGPSYTGSTSADAAGTTVPVPDVGAAVGPEHFMELLNGRWAVYDKETGAAVASSSHLAFWEQAGIAGPIYQAQRSPGPPRRGVSMPRRQSAPISAGQAAPADAQTSLRQENPSHAHGVKPDCASNSVVGKSAYGGENGGPEALNRIRLESAGG